MYKNLLKNTTNITLGDKNELNFAWKVILSFIGWAVSLKWPFDTGARQHKQAIGTQ